MSHEWLIIIWFAVWGLLWAVYFALDGYDLGAGILCPWLPKNEEERHQLVASLGPFWDGNEVWLITAGGATFAAFPTTYAIMFSSLYAPLMIILLGLVFRAVAIEFYNKSQGTSWQRFWAGALSLSSLIVALLLGVAFGNIFQGLPIDQNGYQGTLLTLLNPFGLLTGVLLVLAFLFNGSAWLAVKTEGELADRARSLAEKVWPWLLVAAVLFLFYGAFGTNLFANYLAQPVWFLVPLLAAVAVIAARLYLARQQAALALISGSLAVLFTVFVGIIGIFPAMLPSHVDPRYSITAFNAASSPYTLTIMLIVVLIFLPVVLAYQYWLYRVFSAKVTKEDIESY